MKNKTKVIISEPDPIARASLIAQIDRSANFNVIHDVADTRNLIKSDAFKKCAIIVTELMPDAEDTFKLAEHCYYRETPLKKVIVYTENHDQNILKRALGFGAYGYILKTDESDVLLTALEQVALNKYAITTQICPKLVYTAPHESRPKKNKKVKVILANQFPALLPHFEREFHEENNLKVIAKGSSIKDVSNKFDGCDVLVTSLFEDLEDTLEHLQKHFPGVFVIVYSDDHVVDYFRYSMDKRSCGYLTMSDDVEIVIAAINTVVNGKLAVSSRVNGLHDHAPRSPRADIKQTFDVFLCHNSADKQDVMRIGELLKFRNIRPWLDEWNLRPGLPWQKELEKQINFIGAAAVFVGDNGIGPWQDLELNAFLRQFVKRMCPVIPVILSSCLKPPELPVFLEGLTWVDFRKKSPDPLEQLIWGITGVR